MEAIPNSPEHNSLNHRHARNLFFAIQLSLATNSRVRFKGKGTFQPFSGVFKVASHCFSMLVPHLNVTGSYTTLYPTFSGSLSRQWSLEASSLSTQIDTGRTPGVSFDDRNSKPGFQGAPLTLAFVLEYSSRESNYEKTLRDKAPRCKRHRSQLRISWNQLSTTQDGS